MIISSSALASIGTVIPAAGSLYYGIRHLIRASKKKREAYREEILKEASEGANRVKLELEEKLQHLENEFAIQKTKVSMELDHTRELYDTEMKALGEKVESLRQDIDQQHQQLISLLTKLINNK